MSGEFLCSSPITRYSLLTTIMSLAFEKNKLQRQLDRSGKDFEFFRQPKNKFGEPDLTGTPVEVGTLRGLYHEVNNFIRVRMTDTTQVRQTAGQGNDAKQPKILCLFESVGAIDLKFGDYTIINGKRFNVTTKGKSS